VYARRPLQAHDRGKELHHARSSGSEAVDASVAASDLRATSITAAGGRSVDRGTRRNLISLLMAEIEFKLLRQIMGWDGGDCRRVVQVGSPDGVVQVRRLPRLSGRRPVSGDAGRLAHAVPIRRSDRRLRIRQIDFSRGKCSSCPFKPNPRELRQKCSPRRSNPELHEAKRSRSLTLEATTSLSTTFRGPTTSGCSFPFTHELRRAHFDASCRYCNLALCLLHMVESQASELRFYRTIVSTPASTRSGTQKHKLTCA
jgi:hypothetical protein